MVLYCSAYWDLQLKLKNNDKKKRSLFHNKHLEFCGTIQFGV